MAEKTWSAWAIIANDAKSVREAAIVNGESLPLLLFRSRRSATECLSEGDRIVRVTITERAAKGKR